MVSKDRSKWNTVVTVKKFSILQRIAALVGDRSIKSKLKQLFVSHKTHPNTVIHLWYTLYKHPLIQLSEVDFIMTNNN
jgi:hypothetical protein